MPLRYGCFLSYCHDDGILVRGFINSLVEALESELGPYLPPYVKKVYHDKRMETGYLFNSELAQALCGSACMVVVYSPSYHRHPYCMMEYAAMEALEEQRADMINNSIVTPKNYGLILPVILRGRLEALPDEIRSKRQFADFSQVTTANPEITKREDLIEKVGRMAAYISEVYEYFEDFEQTAETDICVRCREFDLPKKFTPWAKPSPPGFVMRREL